jgi:hypothetical protein
MIANHPALASSPVRRDVLTALSDGITAAHPATVVPARVSLEEGVLRVGEATYETAAYEAVAARAPNRSSWRWRRSWAIRSPVGSW